MTDRDSRNVDKDYWARFDMSMARPVARCLRLGKRDMFITESGTPREGAMRLGPPLMQCLIISTEILRGPIFFYSYNFHVGGTTITVT